MTTTPCPPRASPPRSGPPADETVAVRDAFTRLPADDRELLTLVAWDGLRTELDEATGPTPGDSGPATFTPTDTWPEPRPNGSRYLRRGTDGVSWWSLKSLKRAERRVPIPSTAMVDAARAAAPIRPFP
jgi:hypothetical protein